MRSGVGTNILQPRSTNSVHSHPSLVLDQLLSMQTNILGHEVRKTLLYIGRSHVRSIHQDLATTPNTFIHLPSENKGS